MPDTVALALVITAEAEVTHAANNTDPKEQQS
jgi:hypothetical protein